jgi:DNA ligase (NAD+)
VHEGCRALPQRRALASKAAASSTPRQRAEALRAEIERHNHAYYVDAKPLVSDADYDQLFDELLQLEARFPELRTPNSPTQRAGVRSAGNAIAHRSPMVSLARAKSVEDVLRFLRDVRARLADSGRPLRLVVEKKLDGMAVNLIYENGELRHVLSRGDGERGEEITRSALRYMRDVPLRVASPLFSGAVVEVRGEAVISKADLERVRARNGAGTEVDAPGPSATAAASPRNLVAGLLLRRKQDAERDAEQESALHGAVSLVAYQLSGDSAALPDEHSARLAALRGAGFVTDDAAVIESDDALAAHLKAAMARRDAAAFEIDGFVIKVDSATLQQRLGATTRAPRWAIAIKFPPQVARTQVLDVTFQVGRTGRVTPVAELVPVAIGGVRVTRATLHSHDWMARHPLRRNDWVAIERSGDVIPHVAWLGDSGSNEPLLLPPQPYTCPCELRTPLAFGADHGVAMCVAPSCRAQLVSRVRHFAEALGVDGLGEATAQRLVELGIVKRAVDIIYLERHSAALEQAGGILSPVRMAKLRAAIEAAKRSATPDALLFALSVPHVGLTTARQLLSAFGGSIAALSAATREQLEIVEGIGPVVAAAVYDFFRASENATLVGELAEAGAVAAQKDKGPAEHAKATVAPSGALAGKSVAITGRLHSLTRREAAQRVVAAGGRVVEAVGPRTDLLVAGDAGEGRARPSSKAAAAAAQGVRVLTEEEFLALLGAAP